MSRHAGRPLLNILYGMIGNQISSIALLTLLLVIDIPTLIIQTAITMIKVIDASMGVTGKQIKSVIFR